MRPDEINTDMSGMVCRKGGSCRGTIEESDRGKAVVCGRCGRLFGYCRPEEKTEPKSAASKRRK